MRAALLDAVRTADLDTLAAALRRAERDSRRPAPVGPLRQLETADRARGRHRSSGCASTWRRRSTRRADAACCAAGPASSSLDEADVAPVKALLDEGRASVADLGDALARRLLLGAVVVAA